MKILIVDDDEVARLALSAVLAPCATEIVLAGDGEAAFALLEGGLRPAVCCCDVVMPRLDGLGLLRKVRAHPVWNDLPFILISAAADRATVESAIASGVAGYILKPFLAAQTRNTVERVIRTHNAARAEHFMVTRRRLGVPLEKLEALLEKLRSDAQACADAAEGDAPPVDSVQRLHSGCKLLGLWKAAQLLRDASAATVAAGVRQLALREAQMLIGGQLEELRVLEGTHVAGTEPAPP